MHDSDIIKIENLCVQFALQTNVVEAVKGVSFSIKDKETLALVGESGSGKSVTAMSILRLNEYSGGTYPSGTIKFKNKNGNIIDILSLDKQELRKVRGNEIAMIFQEPMSSLNPVLTIGLQIIESIILHQNVDYTKGKEIAVNLLNLVRIPEPAKQLNQYPHHFSGGMRQRLMIAMALSCKPKLLIADEPSTALDVTIQAQIIDLIRLLQNEVGMAVLFITHDMGVVAEVADRVIVMYEGNIVEEGPVKEIFYHPTHEYTKRLINAVPKLGSMKGKELPEKF